MCVEPEGQRNERLTNSFRAVQSLRRLAGPARARARTWRACTYVTRVYRCVRVQTCACVDRCGRAEGSATGLKDDVNQRAILI